MTDSFEKRVLAAAVAGWWTLLIAVVLLLIQWIGYLWMMNARPEWLRSMWGPGITWEFIRNLCLWMVAVFKMCLWLMALIAIWLTLWARRLRKQAGS